MAFLSKPFPKRPADQILVIDDEYGGVRHPEIMRKNPRLGE